MKAIYTFPRPANQHEVRRFLGLAGYFRRFIVIYAKIAIPLTQLTKKNIQFTWGKEQEETFPKLRTRLCEYPIVQMYDPKSPITKLHRDA